jgi:hypothetical protein
MEAHDRPLQQALEDDLVVHAARFSLLGSCSGSRSEPGHEPFAPFPSSFPLFLKAAPEFTTASEV